jgi:predicted NUDIX family NTP pyrophosphohydrolase
VEISAGIVLLRDTPEREALLVHPGGPFWAKKDLGAWNLPKGAVEPGESLEQAARREFLEETGHAPPAVLVALGEVQLRSGKRVHGFAGFGALEPEHLHSNLMELEYPPRSGRILRFPEVDRAVWASLPRARELLVPALVPLVERAFALPS